MPITHLLYIHGFRSSPQSAKAKTMAACVQQNHPGVTWWCPQLPPSPHAALAFIQDGISNWPRATMAVIGSSLGGFYATALAEEYGCKAVLLNPAVDPARDLARYIGEQHTWQHPEERFFFEPHFIDELRALQTGPLKIPAHYWTLIAQGDEVLDWREMAARYANTQLHIFEGGDHGLSDFDHHLPGILEFLALA